MAKDAKTVDAFLQSVWAPSIKAAKREAAALQALMDKDLPGEKLQPWDWWYYAEKLRKEQYDLDEEELKPYFELSNVRRGVFQLATTLYGLQFEQLEVPSITPRSRSSRLPTPTAHSSVSSTPTISPAQANAPALG